MAATTRIGGTNVTTAQSARWSASILAAVIASWIGGGLALLFWCVWDAFFLRTTLLHPLQIIASYRWGEAALYFLPGWGYLWALALHAGLCTLWGLVYGLIATALHIDADMRWPPVALGIIVGLSAQLIDVGVVAPMVAASRGEPSLWNALVPPVESWIGHLIFGLSFATYPALFRSFWLKWIGRADLLSDDPRIT
jgi:hypothetical protein